MNLTTEQNSNQLLLEKLLKKEAHNQPPSTINMTKIGEEQMTRYIRNETIHPAAFDEDNINEIISSQQLFRNNARKYDSEHSELDQTIDIDINRRCTVYMSGLKCHKGDYCDKIHRYPREDKVLCKYINGKGCTRPAYDCWFWHPGDTVKYVPDEDAPLLVQSMGDIMKYIKKELTKNPNKY